MIPITQRTEEIDQVLVDSRGYTSLPSFVLRGTADPGEPGWAFPTPLLPRCRSPPSRHDLPHSCRRSFLSISAVSPVTIRFSVGNVPVHFG